MAFEIRDKFREIVGQLPGYEARPAQEEMVCSIYTALMAGQNIVVEAGTGSGKSFGYLVPALLCGEGPVVVSTGTIALQEQLINKDIPFVAKAAGMDDLVVKLVKGRRNYLCIQKMREFDRTLGPSAPEKLYIHYLQSELDKGWDGDQATLDLAVPEEIWHEIKSDSEDCLGKRCGFYDRNPYRQAREGLYKADILVVNHALYCQDLSSGQSLLPPHSVVIFDEAHQLRSYALKSFTVRIGKFATHRLIRKIHRRLDPVPEPYQHAIFQNEARVLEWLFRDGRPTFKLFADDEFIDMVDDQSQVLSELREWLAAMDVKQLPLVASDTDEDRVQTQREKLLNQLDTLIGGWEYFKINNDPDRVNWASVDNRRLHYEIKSTPLNVDEMLGNSLWNDKTAVLTSATLASDQNLIAVRQILGIPAQDKLPDRVLPSPFDFKKQSNLYIPKYMPEPNDAMFQPAVSEEVVRILHHSQGRAFVLFTSYSAMHAVSQAVIPNVPFPCRMQGDMPKNRLIEWFQETPNSVLFATATFWEGIDIPGDSLSCVIIDKLPFVAPDDPVHSAMVDRYKRQGKDWFNNYVLPETILKLKQGVGRLIRSKRDSGLVALLDPRVRTKGYGKKILRSLPPMPVIDDLSQCRILDEGYTDLPGTELLPVTSEG